MDAENSSPAQKIVCESVVLCQHKSTLPRQRYCLGPSFNNVYLTQRERDVLQGILGGYSAKEIAKKLGLSFRTVEAYTDNLKIKLQCNTKRDILILGLKALPQWMARVTRATTSE